MATTKRSPRQTWEAIENQAREAEIDSFLALRTGEVEARLRAAGQDPDALRAEGVALARRLSADRARLAWQVEAAEGLAREQAKIDAQSGRFAHLSRADLEARIAVARQSPRLQQPVTVMFRNRKPEEASDDELRAILEEIEALGERDDRG